jgi:hypothetical protein
MALQWETIVPEENYQYTMRLKVFRGWLVKSGDSVKDTVTMSFVADENHEWNPFEE